MKAELGIALAAAFLLSPFLPAQAAGGLEVLWADQFGTTGFDAGDDVSATSDTAYVVGRVGFGQTLPGQASAGGVDAYVRAYDESGTEAWTRQFGTGGFDGFAHIVATDDSIVTAGLTTGAFPGNTNQGGADLFVRVYDEAGTPLSTRQLGTAGDDFALDVDVDATGIYVFGMTSGEWAGETSAGGTDWFLARLDSTGVLVWVDQFGTGGNDPAIFTLGGIALDANGVHVGSTVRGDFPGTTTLGDSDGLLRSYFPDGSVVRTQRFGTPCQEILSGLASHADGLYVAGTTAGDLTRPGLKRCTQPPEPRNSQGGGAATFLRRLDASGAPVWTRQYGGEQPSLVGFTLAIAIDADATGVYVGSEVVRPRRGGIGGEPGAPSCPVASLREDLLIQQVTLDGALGDSVVVGTTGLDVPSGLALGGAGEVYAAGVTTCGLPGEAPAGGADAFVLLAS